jgi:predicted Rossmann fold flavoprotein
VAGLETAGRRALGVRVGDEVLHAEALILATGGASYPETGTRGEMAEWLKALGIPVSPWFPALAPIPLQVPRPEWEGVAFREGTLTLQERPAGKRLAAFAGDIVFTRAGISGPAALELSRATEAARRGGGAFLAYAFASETVVEEDLERTRLRQPHLGVRTWLAQRLPERVCAQSLEALGVPPGQRFKDLARAQARAVKALVTAFPLGAPQAVPLSRGEVAAGGVRLDAVDPRTMRVRGWENLLVCGELLDVDGPVGGYNLQAAFSTGYVAGDSV